MLTAQNAGSLNAIVTGGGSGIGASTAIALAESGVRTAIFGRNGDKLRRVAERSERLTARPCDVADRTAVVTACDATAAEFGSVDIVVNAAGVNVPERMMENVSADDWDLLLRVNATGAFDVMRSVLPAMRERRSGLIVNICSISAKRPGPLGGVAYNASKYAMAGLGLTVSEEDKDRGVRVSTIYPGEVDTPILEARPNRVTEEHRATMLQPDDVAAAVMMIARLPPRAHVPELVIKPTTQSYV